MSNGFDPFNSWKALAYADRIEEILAGGMPDPVTVHIYPTNRCNRNCPWCIMMDERESGESLPDTVFRGAIGWIESNPNIKAVHISGGGEPLLYEHLDDIAVLGKPAVLSTNGVHLNPENAQLFDRIRVSLNAATPETYVKMHDIDGDEFYRVCRNVSAVIDCADKDVGLAMAVNMDNIGEIVDFVGLAADLRVKWVQIRPVWYPSGCDNCKSLAYAMEAYLSAIDAARMMFGDMINIFSTGGNPPGKRGFNMCRATPLHAVITADARFAVCQDVFIKWGSLDGMNFMAEWRSREHMEAIRKIEIEKCPRCVMGNANRIIERAFMSDDLFLGLI